MGNPTVTPITERRHAWGFMVGDPNDGMYTREQATILSGAGICTAGLVMAKAAGAAVAAAKAGNTGNGVMGAVTVGAAGKAGVYVLTIIEPAANVGSFGVIDPDGVALKSGAVAAAYSDGGLGFTLADGATDFAAGDQFTITVAAGTKYVPYDPAGAGHLNAPLAVLGSEYRDATSADRRAGFLTNGPAKVQAAELVWGAGVTSTPQQTAALARLALQGIKSV